VHNLEDVNRLREFGVGENVILLTHGVIDREPMDTNAARGLLGLSGFAPVIGTFGFLLPGKGLVELIHSLALVFRAYPSAYLLMLNADYPTPESQEQRESCEALVRQLGLAGNLSLIHDFLDTEEILFLLSACDAIVYPYQRSEEAASGAIRLGLAAGRPVLTTPLPIFSDVSAIVYQLPGTEARAIAEGIVSFLGDKEASAAILQRQRDWVRANGWAAQAGRISNIIDGCVEEMHGIELRVPRRALSDLKLPDRGGFVRTEYPLNLHPDGDLAAAQKFVESKAARWKVQFPDPVDRASGGPGPVEIVNAQASSTTSAPIRSRSKTQATGFLRRFRLKASGFDFKRSDEGSLSQADRARDLQHWQLAARYYREALDQTPDNAPIWVQYGHALKEAGHLSEAENAYRTSLDLDAGVADTHLQLGHALKIQGRKIEAAAEYFRALALDPASDDAVFELKGLGWTKGRIQLALRRDGTGD